MSNEINLSDSIWLLYRYIGGEMTLQEFVVQCGSNEKAARRIGTTAASVARWLKGTKPRCYLVAEKLKELGVDQW
jgi:hypothetical protein